MTRPLDRRTFIKRLAGGGGTLILGGWLVACTDDGDAATTTTGATTTSTGAPSPTTATTTIGAGAAGPTSDPSSRFAPDVLLEIDGEGKVTITVPKAEMGQGVRTSLAMIVAEELDADWSLVSVVTADGDPRYGDQVTGGSLSISTRFDSLREIGASARAVLVAAAAQAWGVDPADCVTEPGRVVARNGSRTATYGALVESAASIEPPPTSQLRYKDAGEYRIIGTSPAAVDAEAIVTGRATYGSDVVVENMVHAVIARAPMFGGRAASWDDTATRAVPGVLDVVEVSTGVAVVAEHTWAALRGREQLVVTWQPGKNGPADGSSIMADLRARLEPAGADEHWADYTFPFNPHSAIETLTCVADVRNDRCEVWAATQDPRLARAVAGRGSQLPTDQITVHVPLIGGGFGRRLDQDFVEEAVEVSAAVRRPVKVFWSRSDDLQHDRLHPAGACRASGYADDPSAIRVQVELAQRGPVPTGDWRSVTNAPEAFARESFVDELAYVAGEDPFLYRRRYLTGPALATLDAAAEAASWNEARPPGRGAGIAHHATWNVSPTSVVVDVEISGGSIRLDRIVYAIDCGTVVNPRAVEGQLQGAAAFAATAALMGGVAIEQGSVAASAFHDAPILRFDQMPEVEVVVLRSDRRPTGVGEAGVPPLAPAIANAIFAAAGHRLRDLPFRLPA